MGKDKGAKAAAPVKEKKSSKTDAVKSGRVTKATEKPKAVAEKTAKKTAEKVKKSSKKSKKEPTPEPSSSEESSESEEEDDSSSSDSSESEAEKPAAKKEASSDSSSDSSDSESEDEKPAPKAAKKEDKKVAKKEESSDSESDSSSQSEAEASSDSDSDSDSSSDDEEEKKEEEVPSKKRKAEEAAEPAQKKIKVVVNGEEKEATANLFVGNLSWNIDEEWLTREFEEFGELQGVRIITDRDSGRSKGFGYVEFTNAENGAKALEARNGYELDGRGLRVDFSAPRDANASQTPQQRQNDRAAKFGDVKNPPAQTLFVGNISFEADESTLTEYFQEHGSINSIRLPTDRETGAPKGFGYVEMGSIEEAQAAFEALQGADVAGRPIRLDYAAPRDNNGPSGGRGGFGGDRGGRGGRGGGRGGFGDRGGRGGGRGRGGSDRGGRGGGRGGSFNRGGFGDFSGKKVSFD
jgi:nucleolin